MSGAGPYNRRSLDLSGEKRLRTQEFERTDCVLSFDVESLLKDQNIYLKKTSSIGLSFVEGNNQPLCRYITNS